MNGVNTYTFHNNSRMPVRGFSEGFGITCVNGMYKYRGLPTESVITESNLENNSCSYWLWESDNLTTGVSTQGTSTSSSSTINTTRPFCLRGMPLFQPVGVNYSLILFGRNEISQTGVT